MSIRVEMLERRHIDQMVGRMQERHAGIGHAMADNPLFASVMRQSGPAVAFLAGDSVLAVGGLIDFTPTGRCWIWCAFAADIGKKMAAVVQCGRRVMRMYPRRRYEAHIDPSFEAGKRLVKVAGFVFEGTMRAFTDDGSDRELWALCR